jgi:RNA 2',3'-cyclic 3'-phosphodiesterase
MSSPRLFLAVPISEQVRDAVSSYLNTQWNHKPLPGRPVRPESWHFTLKFLGNVPDSQSYSLVQAMKGASFGRSFELAFGGVGAFPRPARASVLWVGLDEGGERFVQLATRVEEVAKSVGFPVEDRPFHPHVTLSRIRPPENLDALISKIAPFEMKMVVEEIVLFQSHLRPDGARYQAIERFALGPVTE